MPGFDQYATWKSTWQAERRGRTSAFVTCSLKYKVMLYGLAPIDTVWHVDSAAIWHIHVYK